MDIVLLKSMAKQEPRHSEPLAGEKSVYFSRRLRRLHTFAICLFIFTFLPLCPLRSASGGLWQKKHFISLSVSSAKSVVPKFKFGKTNPIQKSPTHYTERSNRKNRKIKTNPNEPNLNRSLIIRGRPPCAFCAAM
jgi:hypothetical protein